MNIIFLLIIVSLFLAVGFLAAFIWAVKSGQYEDDYTPSVRMLFEDKPAKGFRSDERSEEAAPSEKSFPNLKKEVPCQ